MTITYVLLLCASFMLCVDGRGGPAAACTNAAVSFLPFCNVSLTIEQRVADLVGRMNLSEKISQIVSNASSVPRLGLPAYQWWEEALHGVALSPGVQFSDPAPAATSFPQVILTASTFNATLWNKLGQVISVEAMAMYNAARSGLTFWSPNINIFRDPRWGRGQETPGEDPLLSSKYAAYFVRGLQQEEDYNEESISKMPQSTSMLKVSSCCKHFTAYDMEKSEGTDCFHFNAEVTLQDLADTYEPPFKSCIKDGQASGLMCSYNRVNGVPTCADHKFLTETVRNDWGFQGYIVSDCDAVALLYEYINYTTTAEDAVADVLQAGMDLNCGTFLLRHTAAAIEQGKVDESSVNRALSNVMTLRMRLGLFDGNVRDCHDEPGPENICSEDHLQLSLEAAEQAIVLLKNSKSTLPFDKRNKKKIAVIGPNGNATSTLLGNYAGVPCKYVTPFQGLQEYSEVIFEPGCTDVACVNNGLIESAVNSAEDADAVVVIVGLDLDQEREGLDRTSLLLPGRQQELVTLVSNASKGPVILVVMSGGPIDISFAKENDKISSILWVGYPGEAGGKAIARVIFGDCNPAGRLTMTWYPQEFTSVSMLDMHLRPNASTGYPGRTYRFYTGKKVFEFGDGLSYTNFSYLITSAPNVINVPISSILETSNAPLHTRKEQLIEETDCSVLNFEVIFSVRNLGWRDSDHVLLLFSKPPSHVGAPKEQLISFKRIHVKGGQSVGGVTFKLNACKDLGVVDEEGNRVLVHGDHFIRLGEIQHSISLLPFY